MITRVTVSTGPNGPELSVDSLPISQYVADGILEVPENERESRVQLALNAGIPLVRQMNQSALSAALQAEREQLERFANRGVEQLRLAGTALTQTLDQKSTALQNSIIQLFGREDSPIPEQIRAKVLSAVRELPEEYAKLLREAVEQMQVNVRSQYQALLAKLEAMEKTLAVQEAVKKEAARGTYKGRVHEEIVKVCLDDFIRTSLISELSGRAVGTEKDLNGGTKGDYLISFQGRPLVVVEAKHQNHSRKSLQAMAKLAESYQQARGAAFCIFAYASVDEAPENRWLFLDAKNRWATCVVDLEMEHEADFFLRSALQLGILVAQHFAQSQERAVPWEQLANNVAQLANLINEAVVGSRSIKYWLDQSVKASTSGRDAFDVWIKQVESYVTTLGRLIQAELDQAS